MKMSSCFRVISPVIDDYGEPVWRVTPCLDIEGALRKRNQEIQELVALGESEEDANQEVGIYREVLI